MQGPNSLFWNWVWIILLIGTIVSVFLIFILGSVLMIGVSILMALLTGIAKYHWEMTDETT